MWDQWDLDDVINNDNDAVPRVHTAHLILDTENTAVLGGVWSGGS